MKINHSPKLIRSMNDASSILLHKKGGNEETAYRDFYNALCDTSPHGGLIKERGFTPEEMIEISRNLIHFGYSVEKYYYLPIYAFYRLKSFRYILEHKEDFLGLHGHEAFVHVALGLKKYFNRIVDVMFSKGYFAYFPSGKGSR